MTLYGDARAGLREDVLEDAYQVSLKTGAGIAFDFNGVKCVVFATFGQVGTALFRNGECYERVGNRSWREIPKTANANRAPAEAPAGGNG